MDPLPTYEEIANCVAGPGVNLETGTPSLYNGCKCEYKCTDDSSCSCKVAYDSERHMLECYLSTSSPPVFECNSNCSCKNDCPNRTTQVVGGGGMVSQLCVIQTVKKGLGVCTNVDISKGSFVGEYVGEVITGAQAKKRLHSQQQSCLACYVVQYREHTDGGTVITTNIDATHKGNIMRFVNHSCSPNLVMVAVRYDSIVPKLCLFASRGIPAGEEICFSYYGSPGELVDTEHLHLGQQPCYCGSKNCVNFLPLDVL